MSRIAKTYQYEDRVRVDGLAHCSTCNKFGEIAEEGFTANWWGDEIPCFVCKHCTGYILTCNSCDSKPAACDDWCMDCFVQQLISEPGRIDDEATSEYVQFREAARIAREAV